jgi:hypothetical protein
MLDLAGALRGFLTERGLGEQPELEAERSAEGVSDAPAWLRETRNRAFPCFLAT